MYTHTYPRLVSRASIPISILVPAFVCNLDRPGETVLGGYVHQPGKAHVTAGLVRHQAAVFRASNPRPNSELRRSVQNPDRGEYSVFIFMSQAKLCHNWFCSSNKSLFEPNYVSPWAHWGWSAQPEKGHLGGGKGGKGRRRSGVYIYLHLYSR